MTNLTQPRYLVIADYPNSLFKIGDITNAYTVLTKSLTFGYPEDYPHLFRLLHWWEFRDEKEMPEYVKGFGKQIYKVHKWKKLTKKFLATVLEDTIEYQFNASSCEPATINEYNEYINNK